MISLTPEPPTNDLEEFCRQFGINNVHIPISRLNPLNPTLQASIIKAINIVIDQQNLPIYVHCLDGRRITGLFVLLLRRLQGYIPEFSYAEFWRFQTFVSASYGEMERSSRELDKFVNDIPHEIIIPLSIPRYLWDGDRGYYQTGLKLKYLQPSGGPGDLSNSGDSQTSTDRSFILPPSSSSLSGSVNNVGVGVGVGGGPSTATFNTITTPTIFTTDGMITSGSDQNMEISSQPQGKQRRPSLARFAPTPPIIVEEHTPNEYASRQQLAALDLAHHRYSTRS